jgi:hypothetical protein
MMMLQIALLFSDEIRSLLPVPSPIHSNYTFSKMENEDRRKRDNGEARKMPQLQATVIMEITMWIDANLDKTSP